MYLKGELLILFAGTLSFIWAKPHLQDNGYRNILVFVRNDVPDEDANIVVEQVKELLNVASEDMYYAYQGRVYIEEVTIVVPNHWTNDMVPSLSGESVRGEIYQEADIQIGRKNNLTGEVPYVQQIKGLCGAPTHEEPGESMLISLEYLKRLHSEREEMIVSYGPIGKLFTQQFSKYHHGVYEEYGYPGKQDALENAEKFPSLYLHSCDGEKGKKATCVVDNYCADVPLKGDRRNYKLCGEHLVSEECLIDEASGEINSTSCYFTAKSTGQDAVSSIGSYQYTDMVTSFCDGTEWFPHNDEAPNLHNEFCEGQSQWETILSHREFANGNNGPVWIEDTTPTFYVKSESTARFVLVIDNSGSMGSYPRMENLHTSAIRWITQLKPGTNVAVVKFGNAGYLVEAVPGKTFVDSSVYQQELIKAIHSVLPNGGGTNMASGLKIAENIMMDPSSPGHAGTVMAFTDGEINEGADIGSEAVWGMFKRNNIRVATVLMGGKINADIETLSRETRGKVLTVSYDGSDLDGPFDWASRTYIPSSNDEWVISDDILTAVEAVDCGFKCLQMKIEFDDQINRNVTIIMRLRHPGDYVDTAEYIDAANVQDAVSGDNIDGWKFSVDTVSNQAILTNAHPGAGEYMLDIRFKKPINITYVVQIKIIGHRSSPNSEPYVQTCQYPQELNEQSYLITGQIKKGNTMVKGANITARISKSMDEDPSETDYSCYVNLKDDGLQQISGDLHAYDGVHSGILDPRICWPQNNLSEIERLQVMCAGDSTPDTLVIDNTFFSSQSDDDEVSPYCCGSSNLTWSKSWPVKHVHRTTYNTSVKNELTNDWFTADFGPPGRISDLKATRVRGQKSGVVKLKWTGAGADPAYGIPAYYEVYYSTQRSFLYTRNLQMSSQVTPSMVTDGSLEPVPIGEEMSITVNIPDLEVPGTYHFAVRAVDSHGQEGKVSNIASIHFHDGSPMLMDVSPHHVHGISKVETPLIEKLRKIYPDERMVQGAIQKTEKNRQMVMEAENIVMEKRLRKRFGNNERFLAKIINNIKTSPKQRELFKKILL